MKIRNLYKNLKSQRFKFDNNENLLLLADNYGRREGQLAVHCIIIAFVNKKKYCKILLIPYWCRDSASYGGEDW